MRITKCCPLENPHKLFKLSLFCNCICYIYDEEYPTYTRMFIWSLSVLLRNSSHMSVVSLSLYIWKYCPFKLRVVELLLMRTHSGRHTHISICV